MKKLIYLLSIAFLMLQYCYSGDSSSSSSNNVNYSFTIINDGIVYKVQGNTANDYGFAGPVNNECTAISPGGLRFTITDPTYSNYLTGNPIDLNLYSGPLVLGTNLMSTSWYLTTQYAGPSNGRIPINITDLGTPSIGDLGTSNYRFGNTIKGNYSGTYYTKPSGSNIATVPHTLSIEFEVVRLY